MVVQTHTLAAKAFADELHDRVTRMDLKGASEMTTGLETCLRALRVLEGSLVTFPNLSRYDCQMVA
jgi:hypothetical protein